MSYKTHISKSGRAVEIQTLMSVVVNAVDGQPLTVQQLNIRTPGRPLPRDFTCSATVVSDQAYVCLGAGHTKKANPRDIYKSIDEALAQLGVTKIIYDHEGKSVKRNVRGANKLSVPPVSAVV